MRRFLIDELRDARKFLSVQLTTICLFIAGLYEYVPAIHQNLPENWSGVAFALILAARLYKQKGLEK
jgi:hypothetical protein